MKIALVTWKDSCLTATGSYDLKEATELHLIDCRTVGFVVQETEEFITLAASCLNKDFRHLNVIPKSGVIGIEDLVSIARTRAEGEGGLVS